MYLTATLGGSPPRDSINTTRWTDDQNRTHTRTDETTHSAHPTGEALHTTSSSHHVSVPGSLTQHTQQKSQSLHVIPGVAGVKLEWCTRLVRRREEASAGGEGEVEVDECWEGGFGLDLSRFVGGGPSFEESGVVERLGREVEVLRKWVRCGGRGVGARVREEVAELCGVSVGELLLLVDSSGPVGRGLAGAAAAPRRVEVARGLTRSGLGREWSTQGPAPKARGGGGPARVQGWVAEQHRTPGLFLKEEELAAAGGEKEEVMYMGTNARARARPSSPAPQQQQQALAKRRPAQAKRVGYAESAAGGNHQHEDRAGSVWGHEEAEAEEDDDGSLFVGR